MYIFPWGGREAGVLLTCLFYSHAAAKLCKVDFRVVRTQGPLDFKACFFPFFLLFRPCMEVPFFLPAPSSSPGLSVFIYQNKEP